jgi:uncharacterized protein YebE (UPF0316 family)
VDILLTIVLPALGIAGLRVADVTLNVLRTVFMVQGRKALSAVFAGAEAGAWLAAAGIVFADLTGPKAVGYVLGVVAGTAIGGVVVEKARIGMVTVRVYVDATHDLSVGMLVTKAIHAGGFAATTFDGHGYRGPVSMVLSTVRRRDADDVIALARSVAPEAFASVDAAPYRPTGQGAARA